jgi:hypothetical protein
MVPVMTPEEMAQDLGQQATSGDDLMRALSCAVVGALLSLSMGTMSQAAEITIFTSMGSLSGVTDPVP